MDFEEKKHIIITGDRGSGKSTLLKELSSKITEHSDIPGVKTWVVRREAVYMMKKGTDEIIKVGEFNPDSTGKENRMKPIYDNFNIYGARLLDALINEESEWVSIDEIGYLESTCEAYAEKLNEVFQKKRVLAVVRQQNVELLNKLCSREDAYIIKL